MNYANILFVPLYLDLDLAELLGEIPDVSKPTHVSPSYSPFWTYEQLLDNPDPWKPGNVWRQDLDIFQIKLKKLVEHLPFTSLNNVRFTIQNSIVSPHLDVNLRDCPAKKFIYYRNIEPCGYRFILKGSKAALKIHTQDRIIKVDMPCVPGGYLINSTSCYHSVEVDEQRLTLYCRGDLDIQKHNTLIKQSILKYPDKIVYQEKISL